MLKGAPARHGRLFLILEYGLDGSDRQSLPVLGFAVPDVLSMDESMCSSSANSGLRRRGWRGVVNGLVVWLFCAVVGVIIKSLVARNPTALNLKRT